MREKKRIDMDRKLQEIEDNHKKKQVREFYREVRKAKGINRDKILICKKKDESFAVSVTQKLNRWVEYFEETLNGNGNEELNEIYEAELTEG